MLSIPQRALNRDELRDAIYSTPYEKMPYEDYWQRLESAYRVGALPSKAAREAHLSEIRSVRLITLNYCPMGCTFCSATNFLHEAQGKCRSRGALGGGRVPDHDRADSRRAPASCAPSSFRTTFSLSRVIGGSCRCAKELSREKSSGRIPEHLAVHQHKSYRRNVRRAADSDAQRGVSPCGGFRHRELRAHKSAGRASTRRRVHPGTSSQMLSAALATGMTPVPPDLDPEFAASGAGRCRADVARGLSLAAPEGVR